MNEKHNNNGRGIFYGVIGVATLVVAIIGATFAYFTASKTNNNVITGNAASITFGLKVERAEYNDATSGLIPMSNSMVETAVNNTDNNVCVDDNGNSVCQVYKITVTNTSTASMFLDGYVTLADDTTAAGGKLGTPTDVTTSPTVMRWAQVFVSGSEYTTAGKTTTTARTEGGTTAGIDTNWTQIGKDKEADPTGKNLTNIYGGEGGPSASANILTSGKIKGNDYDIISRNYIRTSIHTADAAYTRETDQTSALVFNQYLDADDKVADSGTDQIVYYIVVWLSETGTNQTPGATGNATTGEGFFNGVVTFNSAQGGEVSATFSGFATVTPTDNAKQTP